jgi:hypothetical protein
LEISRNPSLTRIYLLVTGTGFGSTPNTGGFGSTNTTGGGLFGGGSTGFGASGGMSTMLFCSGTFWGVDFASLSQAFISIKQHGFQIFSSSFLPSSINLE